jgi:hypothetical protein
MLFLHECCNSWGGRETGSGFRLLIRPITDKRRAEVLARHVIEIKGQKHGVSGIDN